MEMLNLTTLRPASPSSEDVIREFLLDFNWSVQNALVNKVEDVENLLSTSNNTGDLIDLDLDNGQSNSAPGEICTDQDDYVQVWTI